MIRSLILALLLVLFVIQNPIDVQSESVSSLPLFQLKSLLNELCNRPKGEEVAVAYTDVESAQTIGEHMNMPFNPASVIKLAVFLEVFRQVDAGKIRLTDQIVLHQRQKQAGAGFLQYMKVGTPYSVERLANLMITQSDNTATRMLIDYVGIQNINRTIRQIGLSNTVMATSDLLEAEGKNISTAADMNQLLFVLFKKNYLSVSSKEKAMQILCQQRYNWGIPKDLPKDVAVGHKTGSLRYVRHDSGIVQYKNRPYIITVFTANMSGDEAMKCVANISKQVFLWHENQIAQQETKQ